MKKVGRNDPCPCGSGKKFKRCCLGNGKYDAPLAEPIDPLEQFKARVAAALDAESPASIDDANRIARQAASAHNRTAMPDFHGLTPSEMQRLLTQPFTSPALVEVPALLAHEPDAPVMRLFQALIDGIGDGVKSTAKGNLPVKLVQAVAARVPAEAAERFRAFTIRREDDFEALNATRLVGGLAGLITLRSQRFTVTGKCRNLLAQGGLRGIYPVLLEAYATQFNWAYRDRYDDIPGIQSTFMFTLYLLACYGDEWRDVGFYEDAFQSAFPHVVDETRDGLFSFTDAFVARAYTLRTLVRFCEFFGLVELTGDFEPTSVKVTPLFADALHFHLASNDIAMGSPGASPPAREWHGKRVNVGYMSDTTRFAFKELWMSMPDGLLVYEGDVEPDSDDVGPGFVNAVGKFDATALCVGDQQWAAQLRAALPGVSVRVGATPELDDAVDELQDQLARVATGAVPYLMADVDAAAMGQLFAAAAGMYRAQPWQCMEDWQVAFVDVPALAVEGACISVIGAISGDCGMIVFTSLASYLAMIDSMDQLDEDGFIDLGEDFLSLNFVRGASIEKDNRAEIRQHAWEVADANAYPVFTHHAPDGSARDLTLQDVRTLGACATAVTELMAQAGEQLKQEDDAPIDFVVKAADGMEIFVSMPGIEDD